MNRILSAIIVFLVLLIQGCGSVPISDEVLITSEKPKPESSTQSKERTFVIADNSVPTIRPSFIIERIRVKMKEADQISTEELVHFANEILKKDGYDFTVDWEPKGKRNEENLANVGVNYLPFYYSFTGASGQTKEFQLMNIDFGHPCFSTIDIPLTKINGRELTIIVDGKETSFRKPHDFETEDTVLVDKTLKKEIRRWKTPIDILPVGISEDGKRFYFDTWLFYQNPPENYAEQPIGLAIEISEIGELRFVDKKSIPSDEGIDIDFDKKYTEIIYRKYKVKEAEFIVKYTAPCT